MFDQEAMAVEFRGSLPLRSNAVFPKHALDIILRSIWTRRNEDLVLVRDRLFVVLFCNDSEAVLGAWKHPPGSSEMATRDRFGLG